MSRHTYTSNYGVPNVHPSHTNSSNVMGRQAANPNKYEQVQTNLQTNSNKYEQQQTQQQQLQQQQKNKLVSTEYPMSGNHQSASHQHAVPLPHNSFRVPTSNYHVTSPNLNYQQSVPPQTAHQTSERPVIQIGQTPQQQPPQTQAAQQHNQDHKMQQQSSSQQPHQQTNLQYHQGQFGRQQQPANYRSIANQNRVNRQPNVQQPQPNVVPAHPTNAAGTQPLISANNVMHPRLFYINGQQLYSNYSQQIPAPYTAYYQLPPHPQTTDTSGFAIPINPIPSNSHLQNHRQPPHHQMTQPISMAQPNIHNSYMLQQMQRAKDQVAPKREKKPLKIINPTTNQEVNLGVTDRNNSGSNTHSSALKIEAPSPAHNQIQNESQSIQPPNLRTMPSAQSTSDGSAILLATSNETEQTTCDPNYANTEHQMDNEEPPTTPIVSAIADGPSVDITPKQSKNYKRANKSPEWPLPSTDKINTDSSTCDNTTKVASTTLNATSSGSNEWVKPNATKVVAETAAKEQTIQTHSPHNKHHQKSKQTGSNQYTQPKSKAVPIEAPANVQPTHTSAPKVTASAKEQIVVNETKSIGSSKSTESSSSLSSSSKIETPSNVTIQTKHSEKPNQQPKHTTIESSSSDSASTKEKVNEVSMSSGSSNIRANASVQKAETVDLNIKGGSSSSGTSSSRSSNINKSATDETDKVIKSLESMAITETNAEKNDKLDAELVKGGSGQSKTNETTSAPLSDIVSFESNNNSHKTKQPIQDADTTSSQPKLQKSDIKKTDKQVIENDLTNDASANEINPSSTTNSSVNTKDSSKNVPIETSTDNGLAEQLNNIKNNNLTNSTATVTATNTVAKTATTSTNNQLNNNNNIMDKDLDNNAVVEAAIEAAAPTTNSLSAQNEDESNNADQSELNQIQNAKPTNTLANNEKSEITASSDGAIATENANALLAATQTKLTYGKNQWSPDNLEGRKYYDRNQLVQLRDTNIAKEKPQIANNFHHLFKAPNSNFASNSNNNNNKNQSSSSNRNQYNQRPSKQGSNQQMQQGGGKGSKSGMINVILSLRQDVKLNEAKNAWKPTFISGGNANGPVAPVESQDLDNIEVLCKRVRGILNKLTPEKFDPLLQQLQALNINTTEKLSSVISLVFEKAIDEPHFSAAYAQLCQKLSKPLEDKSNSTENRSIFKKELLTKCQNEFQTHVADENSINSKLLPMQQELSSSTDEIRKMELNVLIEEEERKLRRRSVGTVRFIGELYRQDMLLTRIMEWCVITLLNIPTEEKLECLCKLLTTVGQKMETRTGDAETDKKYYRDLTPHFQTMQNIATDKKQHKVSSRVRFMLMDVIELRKNKWVSRRADTNPKKMGQIQKEAEQEIYKQMLSNMSGSGMGGGNNMGRKDNRDRDRNDRNDRGSMRNDLRGGSMSGGGYMNNNNGNKLNRGNYQDNDGWNVQCSNKGRSSNNSTVDPSKFFGASTTKEDLTNTSLGTANQFQWNRMNQQSQAPTNITNSFSALEPEYKPMSGGRSKEQYHSKGSMERGSVSRSGSQHGSRDNSAARNSYSSRSLQQMRPMQMQFNTLPMNSSSSSQNRMRSDKIESTSSSTSNLSSSASITGGSSDPKLSEAISDELVTAIRRSIKGILLLVQHDDANIYNVLDDSMELHKSQYRWVVVRELYNLAVDTSGLNETKRCFIGNICAYWFDNNLITKQDYIRALSEIFSNLEDIAIDVPKIFEWTIQMMSVPFFNNIMTVNDLKDTAEESRSKLLGSLLTYLAYEYGPKYVRNLWKRSKCKFSDFVATDEVEKFVEKYKLQFVENSKETLTPVTTQIHDDQLRNRICQLIRKNDFSDEEEIVDYIKLYVPNVNKQSIRLLTTKLVEAAIDKNKDNFTLNDAYLPRSIKVIKALADGEDEQKNFQLESLYAIQLLSHELEHPSGFLITIFNKLYEEDESYDVGVFNAWSASNEEPLGKGVALKNLNHFFKFLEENNEESEGESGE